MRVLQIHFHNEAINELLPGDNDEDVVIGINTEGRTIVRLCRIPLYANKYGEKIDGTAGETGPDSIVGPGGSEYFLVNEEDYDHEDVDAHGYYPGREFTDRNTGDKIFGIEQETRREYAFLNEMARPLPELEDPAELAPKAGEPALSEFGVVQTTHIPISEREIPTISLPGIVLFPNEILTLKVRATDQLMASLREPSQVLASTGEEVYEFTSEETVPDTDGENRSVIRTIGTISLLRPVRSESESAARKADYIDLQINMDFRLSGASGSPPGHPVSADDLYSDYEGILANFLRLLDAQAGELEIRIIAEVRDMLDAIDRGRRVCTDGVEEYMEEDDSRGRGGTGPLPAAGEGELLSVFGIAADFIAHNLARVFPKVDVSVQTQREWLQTLDPLERLRKLNAFIVRELDSSGGDDKGGRLLQARLKRLDRLIEQRTRRSMVGSGTKYLEQQADGIRKALADPVARLRTAIEHAGMPADVQRQALQELDSLPEMEDSNRARRFDYLHNWLVRLPWSERRQETVSIERARWILNERHSGLGDAKKRIVEYLAVRKLKSDARGPILCFSGPPGVGKSSLATSIATALDLESATVSCAGVGDGTDFLGLHRSWTGAQPGRIMRALSRIETKNPVLVLDEIDKLTAGGGNAGNPQDVLLTVLDPAQNHRFVDPYIDAPFDLSEVFFIATANSLDRIPPPLLDRLEVVELPSYTEKEKLAIASRYLVERQIADCGLTTEQIQFTDEALRAVIGGYTREAGVRELERLIRRICSKAAHLRVEGDESPVEVDQAAVVNMLGAPKYVPDEATERTKYPGVAIGLAWTPTGGRVVYDEVRAMSGTGKLILTGCLGDVLKESVEVARSWVRANAGDYGIDPAFHSSTDLHLHEPEGATPKDGPSGGVAIVTALVSALTGRRVRGNVAMTGEITLSGDVLPVGGIKEKVLAARQVGIDTVILPKRNERQAAAELDEDLCSEITLHFVSRIEEVLVRALQPAPPDADSA